MYVCLSVYIALCLRGGKKKQRRKTSKMKKATTWLLELFLVALLKKQLFRKSKHLDKKRLKNILRLFFSSPFLSYSTPFFPLLLRKGDGICRVLDYIKQLCDRAAGEILISQEPPFDARTESILRGTTMPAQPSRRTSWQRF